MESKKMLKDYPEILAQWDKDLNKDVDPNCVTARSNKFYYWVCGKPGHPSYLSSPDKRIFGHCGCPVCSNHKVIKGVNDFKSQFPTLMLDWNFELNKDFDPEKLSQGSIQRVHWKCHVCGHTWERSIRDATKADVNCPACSRIARGKKRHQAALKSNGCLSDEKLLLDWDYSKNKRPPSDYPPGSNERVFWKCHVCGHEWSTTVGNRALTGRGCPKCSNNRLVPGKNDLGTVMPELAKEWHPTKNGDLKPSDVFPSSGRKVWWLCPMGHEYEASIYQRSGKNGTNCPKCNSGRQTSFREQAVFFYTKKLFPNSISRYKAPFLGRFELDIFIPELGLGVEYDGEAWHKKERFERERRKYNLCHEKGIGLLRIKEKMPEELGLDIADVMISGDDFESIQGFTKALHNYFAYISPSKTYFLHPMDIDLVRDRFEIMKYASIVQNSFADAYPELAKEWHPTKNKTLKPNMFKPHSDFLAWWVCPTCGKEYEQTIGHRSYGNGCPTCRMKKAIQTRRVNLVKEKGPISDPKLLEEWDYIENGDLRPEQFTSGSSEKVGWCCSKCGFKWKAVISNRTFGRRGCPKCSGRKLIIGYNDLASALPELLKEWDYQKNGDLDPGKIHCRSTTRVHWICSVCGHEYEAPLSRRGNGSGCRKCADKANGEKRKQETFRKNGSLQEKRPDLVKEYAPDNPIPPDQIVFNSKTKAKWICSVCGNVWETSLEVRAKNHGCPKCAIRKAGETRHSKKRSKQK